jgi:3D (Asp-Asp-Asp) domain-containing protein
VLAAAGLALLLAAGTRVGADEGSEERALEVTATAYNSMVSQTNEDPTLTAWGDRLAPGMQAIAVSRDLIELGLDHGVEVEIEGLPGRWVVRDKMARRWKRTIDVYMGEDVQAARRWGRRKVRIHWRVN